MNQIEGEINMSISKIFNWGNQAKSVSLELEFFSQKTGASIIKKQVVGELFSNALNVNCLLRITYTEDQNVITMNMYAVHGEQKNMLGEFQIDLVQLSRKRVQYFSFGQDQVLQINTMSDREIVEKSRVEEDNENFIRERESFIGRKKKGGMKKSFSEKVLTLLRQVHELKGKPEINQPSTSRFNTCFRREQSTQNLNPMPKSHSEKRLQTRFSSARNQNQPSLKSPRHKLILNTLNVVPSEEYYTEPKRTQQTQWRHSRPYH